MLWLALKIGTKIKKEREGGREKEKKEERHRNGNLLRSVAFRSMIQPT